MFTQPSNIQFDLPGWVSEYAQQHSIIAEIPDRMSFVIAASQINIQKKTGGPFAAAIFEYESGKLVSLGVNLVTTQGLSVLHAEIVAISLAQTKLGIFDLSNNGLLKHELITSTEPCAMCLGAIPWSGISRVVTGARDADARSIGFNEGHKAKNWCAHLATRDIAVVQDIKRNDAKQVLINYAETGGIIYNSNTAGTTKIK